jgi:dipeptidyl aminopeptidase/acylaminoacyl peptidase
MDDVRDLLERVHRQIVDEPGSFERVARRRHHRQRRRRVIAGVVAIAVMAAVGVLIASLGGLGNDRGSSPATTPNDTQPPLTRPIVFGGLRTIQADGSGLARLPEGGTPTWSPDGTEIAFVGPYHDSQSGLFVMKADGTSVRKVVQIPGVGHPAWSPDGIEIAFTAHDENGAGQIFVIRPDGTGLTQLTHIRSPSFVDGPGLAAWSSDGSEILFSSDQNIASDIYVMTADGSDVRNLTHALSPDLGESAPQWSPDGSRILFVHDDGYENNIYTMAPDGSDWRMLRMNVGGWPHPRWSPDGRWIVFEADAYGAHPRLVVMDAAGGNVRTIFHGADPIDPAWG